MGSDPYEHGKAGDQRNPSAPPDLQVSASIARVINEGFKAEAVQIFRHYGLTGLMAEINAPPSGDNPVADRLQKQMCVDVLCVLAGRDGEINPIVSSETRRLLIDDVSKNRSKPLIISFMTCVDLRVPELRDRVIDMFSDGFSSDGKDSRSFAPIVALQRAAKRLNSILDTDLAHRLVEGMLLVANSDSTSSAAIHTIDTIGYALSNAKGRGLLSKQDEKILRGIAQDDRFRGSYGIKAALASAE